MSENSGESHLVEEVEEVPFWSSSEALPEALGHDLQTHYVGLRVS